MAQIQPYAARIPVMVQVSGKGERERERERERKDLRRPSITHPTRILSLSCAYANVHSCAQVGNHERNWDGKSPAVSGSENRWMWGSLNSTHSAE